MTYARRSAPAAAHRGDSCAAERARGGRIEAFIDGRPVIDVTDTRYAGGRIGLNVFGGRTAYQGTFVTAL
ncbi:hypothetical protein ACFVYE_36100 [Streptomyces sp. NPDC058239]|uniref:hypothetical protein n=1 Tax=unclassified Streptomyces TaxID=2593676 RepID=UPI00366A1255